MNPDAVLLLSFGDPEAPEEVRPFLENVTAGRELSAAIMSRFSALIGERPPKW